MWLRIRLNVACASVSMKKAKNLYRLLVSTNTIQSALASGLKLKISVLSAELKLI